MPQYSVECITDNEEWYTGEMPSCGISMELDDDFVEAENEDEAIDLTIDWLIDEARRAGTAEIVDDDLKIVKVVAPWINDDCISYCHSWKAKKRSDLE